MLNLKINIQKIVYENTILFPMGDARFMEPKQNDLLKDFEKLETDVIGEGKHEELHRLLGTLKGSICNNR